MGQLFAMSPRPYSDDMQQNVQSQTDQPNYQQRPADGFVASAPASTSAGVAPQPQTDADSGPTLKYAQRPTYQPVSQAQRVWQAVAHILSAQHPVLGAVAQVIAGKGLQQGAENQMTRQNYLEEEKDNLNQNQNAIRAYHERTYRKLEEKRQNYEQNPRQSANAPYFAWKDKQPDGADTTYPAYQQAIEFGKQLGRGRGQGQFTTTTKRTTVTDSEPSMSEETVDDESTAEAAPPKPPPSTDPAADRALLKTNRTPNRTDILQNRAKFAPTKGGAAAPAAEPIAVNPKTGERVVLRGGAWVPLK